MAEQYINKATTGQIAIRAQARATGVNTPKATEIGVGATCHFCLTVSRKSA